MILDNKTILAGVFVLHVALIYQFSQQRISAPAEPIFLQAVPLAMGEVAPEPKPQATKPLAKIRQKIQKARQNVRERIASTKRVQQTATPERSATMEVAASAQNNESDKAKSSNPESGNAAGQQGQSKQVELAVSEPSFQASYLSNPKPPYPPTSLALGEQGKVLLRVVVNPAGLPEKIEIFKSSGFARLDAVAQSTVQRWRFVPAKRGDEAVSGSVIVPLNFSIKNA
ncbi:TonB family protein [Chitinibacter sp. S2-10]|uniref:energy transducer TonB n=1 Tax=Chitinibacter sp. S2-10 TaxID=3373597 RepID=UPI00397760F2